MSSTNKTANYELSQFVGTDIPSILSDYNGDMRKIDAGIAEVATSAGSSASAVSALAGRVTTAENSITSLNGALEVTNQRSIQNQTAITAVQGVIPDDASTENKVATSEEVSDIADEVRGIDTRVTALENGSGHKLLATFASSDYSTINDLCSAIRTYLNDLDVATRCRVLLYDNATMSFLSCTTKSGERFEHYSCGVDNSSSSSIALSGCRYEISTSGGQIFDYSYSGSNYTRTIRNNTTDVPTVELYI